LKMATRNQIPVTGLCHGCCRVINNSHPNYTSQIPSSKEQQVARHKISPIVSEMGGNECDNCSTL
jgi:hypothetical protein